MKRTLISLAILATAAAASGPAFAQTAIAGGAGIMLPPGGANAADVMITSNGPVYATTSIAEVVATASTPGMMTASAPRMRGEPNWAQRRIEQDGYRNVRNVGMGPDGLWHGTARRGNTDVAVTVDSRGNVSSM